MHAGYFVQNGCALGIERWYVTVWAPKWGHHEDWIEKLMLCKREFQAISFFLKIPYELETHWASILGGNSTQLKH